MTYTAIVGDLEDPLVLTASEDLSDAVDVELLWRKPDGTESLVELEVVNAEAGQFRRVWVAGDTDMAGVHRGRLRVTWPGVDPDDDADDRPQTYPNDGTWFLWIIYA